ncbi:hypothetical protein ACSS6W_002152 [Trichoderma asperelloides]
MLYTLIGISFEGGGKNIKYTGVGSLVQRLSCGHTAYNHLYIFTYMLSTASSGRVVVSRAPSAWS